MIRPAQPDDAAALAEIYNHYIAETVVTFEEAPVTAETMQQRVQAVRDAGLLWLVLTQEAQVVGYAYATPWKARAAYRYSAESSVYLAPSATGRGLGRQLYQALLSQLRGAGIHALNAGIALPNAASVALHEGLGFKPIGVFREVGYKFERWVDVGYWQLFL